MLTLNTPGDECCTDSRHPGQQCCPPEVGERQ